MTIYIDRWGGEHVAGQNSAVISRRGIFGICLTRDHILITWPRCAPDCPEIPGGGIDDGESNEAALIREIYEETGAKMASADPVKIHSQMARLYADNSSEYWDYDQIYWVLKGPTVDEVWFEGQQETGDAVKAMWVPLTELSEMPLHAIHREALKVIL